MKTFQLRIYTLKSAQAAEAYRAIWIKHIESLKAFGITTHGVFTVPDAPTKVIALVNYPQGSDPAIESDRYMTSDLFKADMVGFDFSNFVSVETTLLAPEPCSPLI
ncbi:NIPSNAP family protein [Pleomorphomonas sp. PLEO]|uniref:NIPSNAP family protein n=1 Tax=Pleomorphomonas sp. PLEO TaxID=3239306 RepID=UPI00351DE91D